MQEKKLKIGSLTFGRKEIKYYVLVFLGFVVVMWTWAYLSLLNSNGYAFAQKYLDSNPTVKDTIGDTKSIRPGFARYKSSYIAGVWTMAFQVVLEGTKDSGYVTFRLRGSDNNWTVEEATLKTKDHGEAKL